MVMIPTYIHAVMLAFNMSDTNMSVVWTFFSTSYAEMSHNILATSCPDTNTSVVWTHFYMKKIDIPS